MKTVYFLCKYHTFQNNLGSEAHSYEKKPRMIDLGFLKQQRQIKVLSNNLFV